MTTLSIEDIITSNKNLYEKINDVDVLISETKKGLGKYSDIIYPKEHEFYKQRLHSYELTRSRLIDVLMEGIIKKRS